MSFIRVVGFSTVVDSQPIWLEATGPPGSPPTMLTVLYGLNGVGKTRLLRGLAATLSGVHEAPVPGQLIYSTGSAQILHPITADSVSDPTAVAHHISRDLWIPGVNPFGGVTFEDILERTQAQLAERHLPPELGEELLRNGHLLCLPVRGPHDARTALFLGTLLADELVNERFPVYQDSDQFFQHLTAIEGGDDGILPLPHTFIDGVPEWAAMPLLHLGDVGWDLVGVWATDGLSGATESVEGIDSVLARRTWETAIARTKHSTAHRQAPTEQTADEVLPVVLHVPGASLRLEAGVVAELNAITGHANFVFRSLSEPVPTLVLAGGSSLERPAVWSATWDADTSRRDAWFPLSGLGDAHRRLAALAINAALNAEPDPSRPRADVVLIDEPERATHPLAARRLADGLQYLGNYVIAASHSLDVLDNASHVVHVRRDAGQLVLDSRPLPISDDEFAERFGLSRVQAHSLTKVFVLVEGPHDEAIIQEFCGSELARCRARVLTLGGTRGVSQLPEARWFVQATDARFLVVLDNIEDAQQLGHLLADLRRASTTEQQHAIRHKYFRGGRRSDERAALDAMLDAAITTGTLARFEPFGFKKRDIAFYLPVTEIVPSAASWEALSDEFLEHTGRKRFRKGDGAEFKSWVKAKKRGRYDVVGIRQAAHRIATRWDAEGGRQFHRPPEFSEFATRLEALASIQIG